MAFHTVLLFLNNKMPVTLTDEGLPDGLMQRTDRSGTRYYTEDGRRFRNMREALEHRGWLRRSRRASK